MILTILVAFVALVIVLALVSSTVRDVFGGLFTGWSSRSREIRDAAKRYDDDRREHPDAHRYKPDDD